MLKSFFAGLALTVLPVLTLAQAQDAQTINFGIISTESSQNLKTTWEPFIADMAKETGLNVKPFFATDYAGVIEAMRFGKVQLAWYGNKSAMEAVDRADAEIFAQTADAEGNPGYWSVLVTSVDSPLNDLNDVLKCDKTLNFGIGDPNSTSGYLVPMTYIFAEKNVEPKECFKTVRNANHETNAMAAANKQVDVAANNTENMRRLEVTNPEAFKKLKVIWQSPLIPADPLVWRSDLDQATKDKLYTFIMTYGRNGTPEEIAHDRQVLKALQWAPFRPSSNAQLYPIRTLELTKQLFKVKGDQTLAEADRQAKVAELEAKIAEVNKQATETPSM
ncbi:phosphonate transport system substrate-binding protein [Rhodoligotrophos appendicifer]|uniref:phosphonate ABC transporter substrate-binding protein n=1 Tax=Rhodoligotrophos appendicifer TaxID=987056 RepID=UPI00117DE25B|nr:phosphonate ABC transporter substrate-binding protein [Rhodoligotrophos appendicifer]